MSYSSQNYNVLTVKLLCTRCIVSHRLCLQVNTPYVPLRRNRHNNTRFSVCSKTKRIVHFSGKLTTQFGNNYFMW